MKYIRISLSIILAAAVNLCMAGTLNITGHLADKKLNGKPIFIKERINKEWITCDQTTIQNNKFTFREKADSAKIVYLIYTDSEGHKNKQAFILEPGNLTVKVNEKGLMTIAGTDQNNKLQPYQEAISKFYDKAEAYYEIAAKDSALTYEEMLSRSQSDDELAKEELAIHKKYASELINTIAGTYIFVNSYYLMSTEEKTQILEKMNSQQKQLQQIKDIQTTVENENRVAPGKLFTEISMPDISNSPRSLSQYVGKTEYILLDFWASWCPDCMRFLPQLITFYNKHHGNKFEIVGVSLDENKQSWTGAIQRKNIPWVNISDIKGWKSEGAVKYGVSSIPCTYLIDKAGKIICKNPSLQQLENIISKDR